MGTSRTLIEQQAARESESGKGREIEPAPWGWLAPDKLWRTPEPTPGAWWRECSRRHV